jgi:TRAP-type C4-dicarboxylate transport system substrate-binding protein
MRGYRLWVVAAVFGMLGVGLSVQAQTEAPVAVRTLSIATLAPAGSTWMRVFDAWNREVRRRSNKSLQLRFYPGGVQGDESEVIRKVRGGRLDGAAVTAVGLAQIHRPALVFQMPGMFSTYQQLDRAREGLSAELNSAFENAGFALMGWADVGQTRVFSRTPVRTPQDLAATHPFVWREDLVMPVFYSVIHASPVPLQVPEVLSAFQTHRIDSIIVPPVACVALQWAGHITHMTDMPSSISIGAVVLGRNQLNSLTPEHQTILSETAAQFHALARRNLRADETNTLASLQQRNVTVVPVDAAQRAAWEHVFSETRSRLAGQLAAAAFIQRVQRLAAQ